MRHFLDPAGTPDREALIELGPAVLAAEFALGHPLGAAAMPVGHDRPRIDADDAHAVAHAFAAEALREHDQCRIAAGGRDVAGLGPLAGHADDIDDDAALARFHARQDVAGEIDVAEHLEVPAAPPGRRIDVVERAARNGAGIVDEDVAVAGDIRQVPDVLELRQIETVGDHLHAVRGNDLVGDLAQPPGVGRHQREVAAFLREHLGDRFTDAARSAGDQRRAAFEIELHCNSAPGWMA